MKEYNDDHPPLRDRIVHKVCNFLIDHMATSTYRKRLTKVIELGFVEYWRTMAWNHLDKPTPGFKHV